MFYGRCANGEYQKNDSFFSHSIAKNAVKRELVLYCYVSCHFHCTVFYFPISKRNALAGNRTRTSRVAGENSTTEPPVPC